MYQLLYLIADCLMVCCSLKHILKKGGIFWGPFVVTYKTLGEWIIDLGFLRVVRRFIYPQLMICSIEDYSLFCVLFMEKITCHFNPQLETEVTNLFWSVGQWTTCLRSFSVQCRQKSLRWWFRKFHILFWLFSFLLFFRESNS